MRSRFEMLHPKAFPAVLLIALIAGAFAFLVVQVALPWLLGPAGLLLVLGFDLGLAIKIRHRRRRRRHPSRIVFGPIEKRWRVRRRDAFEKEIAVGFVLGVFLLVVYAIGVVIRIEFWWINQDLALYVLGTAMTTLALWVWGNQHGPLAFRVREVRHRGRPLNVFGRPPTAMVRQRAAARTFPP